MKYDKKNYKLQLGLATIILVMMFFNWRIYRTAKKTTKAIRQVGNPAFSKCLSFSLIVFTHSR